MSAVERLRLLLLRDAALDELPALDLNVPEQCQLRALLILAIIEMSKLLKENEGAPTYFAWRRR